MYQAHVGDFKQSSLRQPFSFRNTSCAPRFLTYKTIWIVHNYVQNGLVLLSRTQTLQQFLSRLFHSVFHLVSPSFAIWSGAALNGEIEKQVQQEWIWIQTNWTRLKNSSRQTSQFIKFHLFRTHSQTHQSPLSERPSTLNKAAVATGSAQLLRPNDGSRYRPPTGGIFFLHWAQIRENTDNHLLLQITAAAPPATRDLIPKCLLYPLLETKHGLMVTVEKEQMIKSSKMSPLCIRAAEGGYWY